MAAVASLADHRERRVGDRRHGPPIASSSFLRELGAQIHQAWVPEAELTMRVAVMSAAGMTRRQIQDQLGCDELDIKMAVRRLQRVASGWKENAA